MTRQACEKNLLICLNKIPNTIFFNPITNVHQRAQTVYIYFKNGSLAMGR